MKIISTIFLIVICVHIVSAQSWEWANYSYSSASCDNYGKSIVSDKSGNTYITGRFSSPLMSFSGPPNLLNASTSGCYNDFYIAKFDSLGNRIWAQRAGGLGAEGGNSIALDTSGNIYVTGFCGGTLTFDTVTLTSSSPAKNFFIVKYTPSGNALWARVAKGTGDESGYSIATDSKNNVYVTGVFEDKIIFGADTIATNTVMAESAFIIKYDSEGNKLWVKGANLNGSSSISGYIRGEAICTDVSGSIYVAGNFNASSLIMDTDTIAKISPPGPAHDLFLMKLDSLGNMLWCRNYGAGNDMYTNESVTTDKYGNVFLTGGYIAAMTMGSTTLPFRSGRNKIFVAKLNSSGNVLWAQSAAKGTPLSFGTDIAPNQGRSIVADSIGNVWVTGNLTDSANFGSISLYGWAGVFLVKYDPLGNAVFGTCINGSNYNAGTSVSLDKDENVYITGFFQSLNLTFGSYTISNYGFRNVFIAKLGSGLLTGMEEFSQKSSFIIFPNPFSSQTTIVFSEIQKNLILKIVDIQGKKIKELNFTGKELIIEKGEIKNGIYFLQVIDENKNIENRKIIIQ